MFNRKDKYVPRVLRLLTETEAAWDFLGFFVGDVVVDVTDPSETPLVITERINKANRYDDVGRSIKVLNPRSGEALTFEDPDFYSSKKFPEKRFDPVLAEKNSGEIATRMVEIDKLIKECMAFADEAAINFSLPIKIYPDFQYVGKDSDDTYEDKDYGWQSSAHTC